MAGNAVKIRVWRGQHREMAERLGLGPLHVEDSLHGSLNKLAALKIRKVTRFGPKPYITRLQQNPGVSAERVFWLQITPEGWKTLPRILWKIGLEYGKFVLCFRPTSFAPVLVRESGFSGVSLRSLHGQQNHYSSPIVQRQLIIDYSYSFAWPQKHLIFFSHSTSWHPQRTHEPR